MTGGEIIASKAIEAATSDKAQGLIKGLFGKAFEETGEMIADQVRLRRFKNQVKILKKAQSYLTENSIDTQKISLKVLSPLLEYSSLEEEESLQERWSKLIKNILLRPLPVVSQQNAVEILNKISNDEAELLDNIYNKYIKGRKEKAAKQNAYAIIKLPEVKAEDFPVDIFSFEIKSLARGLGCSLEDIEIQISNLVALGTLKYEVEVDVKVEKPNEDFEELEVDVEVDVSDYIKVRITRLGVVFVELCT
ncbi:Abi-alpha family protein [Hymenobacter chitinivorans]|uniref:DUF4393 domain-containing protein n=1 Tax=Hymenobacter chitinivorans DSM 11115 TaxID=1121954 RepID=A0A2M9BKW2_9BACT|nr:hypothetical protein [Hymenobacter chitinivorans]PJJ58597.1 hypothetical protein CLV45_0007 [Hymenobacter chitinivorans DSM 11115]